MSGMYEVLRRPIITEKGLTLKEQEQTLCFEVENGASKQQIQEAVERILDRKSTRLNSSHSQQSRMPSSA